MLFPLFIRNSEFHTRKRKKTPPINLQLSGNHLFCSPELVNTECPALTSWKIQIVDKSESKYFEQRSHLDKIFRELWALGRILAGKLQQQPWHRRAGGSLAIHAGFPFFLQPGEPGKSGISTAHAGPPLPCSPQQCFGISGVLEAGIQEMSRSGGIFQTKTFSCAAPNCERLHSVSLMALSTWNCHSK